MNKKIVTFIFLTISLTHQHVQPIKEITIWKAATIASIVCSLAGGGGWLYQQDNKEKYYDQLVQNDISVEEYVELMQSCDKWRFFFSTFAMASLASTIFCAYKWGTTKGHNDKKAVIKRGTKEFNEAVSLATNIAYARYAKLSQVRNLNDALKKIKPGQFVRVKHAFITGANSVDLTQLSSHDISGQQSGEQIRDLVHARTKINETVKFLSQYKKDHLLTGEKADKFFGRKFKSEKKRKYVMHIADQLEKVLRFLP